MAEFDISLRGYDRATIDDLVHEVEAAAGDPVRIAAAVRAAGEPTVALRGYDRVQVDAWLAERGGTLAGAGGGRGRGGGAVDGGRAAGAGTAASGGAGGDAPRLMVVLRGYRIAETDALFATIGAALNGDDPFRRAEALRAIHEARLPVVFRGYDRGTIDTLLERAARDLSGGQVH
ncbi:hypothetical protein [Asanoa ferruginea]|uniref:hypothetical protein n=1 Tax=Asanoa ferruginea TaxID=53367 RepID=UPI0011C17821|nr:hypothetical protein [Asanoa ferruginea]